MPKLKKKWEANEEISKKKVGIIYKKTKNGEERKEYIKENKTLKRLEEIRELMEIVEGIAKGIIREDKKE